MATSTQEWIDELKSISVLELSERIKALEEAFGVSATAVAAVRRRAGRRRRRRGRGEPRSRRRSTSSSPAPATRRSRSSRSSARRPAWASRRPRRSSTRPPSPSRRASTRTRPRSSRPRSKRPAAPSRSSSPASTLAMGAHGRPVRRVLNRRGRLRAPSVVVPSRNRAMTVPEPATGAVTGRFRVSSGVFGLRKARSRVPHHPQSGNRNRCGPVDLPAAILGHSADSRSRPQRPSRHIREPGRAGSVSAERPSPGGPPSPVLSWLVAPVCLRHAPRTSPARPPTSPRSRRLGFC